MLGLPTAPGLAGTALLAAGLVVAAAALYLYRRALGSDSITRVLAAVLAVTLGLAPFLAWRIVEDIRYTTGLDAFERRGAGPIQAFLQPYLLDAVPRLVPRDDTYATVVGDRVPYDAARKAFPALALDVLFPRRSVADPSKADWLVSWGIRPRAVIAVSAEVVARPRSGVYPEVFVGRVAHGR